MVTSASAAEEKDTFQGRGGGLPDAKIGTFLQSLMDEAKNKGWVVISMKKDWKRIFTVNL